MNESTKTDDYEPGGNAKPDNDVVADPIPSRIGRYRIDRVLGKGGFGLVYLAYDEQLLRLVAIKVPHRKLVARADAAEAYLIEARTAANLDHPHIVPVYDVGSTENCPCYVVSKYIDGADLARRVKQSRLSIHESVELVATVAEALHYSHKQAIVHRDIKPGNILVDKCDKPFVADFGLALREQDVGKGPSSFVGTPAYMSPEQARCEGHRVDGRSDIFSLGIVLYELLTGRRPFNGEKQDELREQITSFEARPPRQIDDQIPKELDRICLKALSKRASERYSAARDMADDLREFLQGAPVPEKPTIAEKPRGEAEIVTPIPNSTTLPPSESRLIKIVPKGLRSFDAYDSNFFLELLPGPYDRNGMPESVRFWKTKIQESDPDKTFSVGLIYGPSGCGKSSLVKAGLLPRLSENVIAVYVESTPEQTEARLLNGLRRQLPDLDTSLSLIDSLAAVRRGRFSRTGQKVLLVLDQFEQWLHARRNHENTELAQAIRHCEGGRLQCLVMVRDDFWMAMTRFMTALEVELIQGKNIAAVDLFSQRHAKKVLAGFGRAFGALGERADSVTKDQDAFLEQAVAGLAQGGNVIPVRLAVFGEMVKNRPWKLSTLKELRDMEGVVVSFLEETFIASTAPPQHQFHQKAAQAVLNALLPEEGSTIKGHMRSHAELLEASNYGGRPKDFDDLMRILNSELRLITPTDREGAAATADSSAGTEKYYQLTHDYLVHSLRNWLTRKETESRRGRAKLLLKDRAAVWNARRENRQLPSPWQWLQITWLTKKHTWTPPQRRMMAKASRHHALRMIGLAALLLLAGWSAWEYQGRTKARALVASLLRPGLEGVAPILDEMAGYRGWAQPLLVDAFDQANGENDSDRLLKVRLALLRWDPAQAKEVYDRLLDAKAQDFSVVRAELAPFKHEFTTQLWTKLEDKTANTEQRFRAACALADYSPDDARWAAQGPFLVSKLVAADALALKDWKSALDRVGTYLLPALASTIEEGGEDATQQRRIFELYASFCAGKPDGFSHLDNRLAQLSKLAHGLDSARRVANVAAVIVGLQHGTEKAWHLLTHAEDPTARSFLIERLGTPFVDPGILEERLKAEPDLSARRALILALGASSQERLPGMQSKLVDLYKTDEDAGIHSAVRYVFGKWGLGRVQQELDDELATGGVKGNPRWCLTKQRQTLSVIEGPATLMMHGKQPFPPAKHRFAIGSTEVTVRQFRVFVRELGIAHKLDKIVAPTEECPVNSVSWHLAARYCNWLNEQEQIPEDQYCYRSANREGDRVELVPNYQSLRGYRLPTAEEWQFACRAGAVKTQWSFGVADGELASCYAWWFGNSRVHGNAISHPVASLKPNDFGLFDMHGNVAEWCQEWEKGPFEIDDRWGVQFGGQFISDYLNTGFNSANPIGRKSLNSFFGFRLARTAP